MGGCPALGQDGQFHRVKEDKPPFKVFDYIVRIEWQKRGYPHAHILLWTDVPDVTGKKRPEHAAAEGEEEKRQEEVDWSERKYLHTWCRPAQRTSATSTSAPNRPTAGCQDGRSTPRTRKVMAKLATFVEHTCGPYCWKYTIGACRFGFRGPPRSTPGGGRRRSSLPAAGSQAWRHGGTKTTASSASTTRPSFALAASMDLQVVCKLNCASKYILGYCFKSEEDMAAKKRVDNIVQGYLQDPGRQDDHQRSIQGRARRDAGRTTSQPLKPCTTSWAIRRCSSPR